MASVERDYIARVTDAEFPKAKAAALAKQWDKDYQSSAATLAESGVTFPKRTSDTYHRKTRQLCVVPFRNWPKTIERASQ